MADAVPSPRDGASSAAPSAPASARVPATAAAAASHSDAVQSHLAAMEAALTARSTALASHNLAADLTLKHKLSTGRTRNAKLLSEAVKQQDYQDHVKKVAASKQEEELKAKLAAGSRSARLGTSAGARPAARPDSAAPPSILEAAMAAALAADEARESALSAGLSEAEVRAAQTRAAQAGLSDTQKGDEAFMKLLRDLTDAEATKEVHTARQLNSADEALLGRLKRGKSTKQQRIIERAFQNQNLVASMQALEKQRQMDAMSSKLAAGKRKNLLDTSSASSFTSGPPTLFDEALTALDSLLELKDEALADGKIKNDADARRVEQTALGKVTTEAQRGDERFVKMLRGLMDANASKDSLSARQLPPSSDDALLRRLLKGRTPRQQRLIERAFQDPAFVAEVQKVVGANVAAGIKASEEFQAAKLAAKKRKADREAAEAAAAAAAAAGAGGAGADGVDGDLDTAASELAHKKKAGGKVKAAMTQAADSAALLDTMVAALLHAEEAREQAQRSEGRRALRKEETVQAVQRAVGENLTEEQQEAQSAFISALHGDVAAALLASESAPPRLLNGSEEALLRRLKQGKLPRAQAQLDRVFRVPATAERLGTLDTQRSDDASIARLLQNKAAKKKELLALANAADSQAQLEAVLAALTHIEQTQQSVGRALTAEELSAALHRAVEETLTEEQRGNEEIMGTLSRLAQEAAARSGPASKLPPRPLDSNDADLLRRLQRNKPAEQQQLFALLFRDAALVESLRGVEEQRETDASVAANLVAKNKKRREQQAAEQAAEEAMEAEATRDAEMRAKGGLPPPSASSSPTNLAQQSSLADVATAAGVDGAKEFAAMLAQASLQQASQDLARSRQAEKQSEALMKKLLQGKNTKQKQLIEAAFAQAGLVEQKVSEQARKQEEAMAQKIALGSRKKKKGDKPMMQEGGIADEEKYAEPFSAAVDHPAPGSLASEPVVDYLEQKYGEMMAAEEEAAARAREAQMNPLQVLREKQEAIAVATTLGMNAGADGGQVAQIAAHAAAMGLSAEQITAAASAAAQVAALGDDGEADHATFMELFRKATEDATAEHMRRLAGQASQDDAFRRKLLQGKKTKQQQLVDKQMADILAANKKALSFQDAQELDFAARLARGKQRKAAAGGNVASEEANRIAAETLAQTDMFGMNAGATQAHMEAAAMAEEIAAIEAAPTILDELLAVSDAQDEEIARQARETGASVDDIIAANRDALEVDNVAAQLMLEKAREAEAQGDAEGAAAFMDMYRRMVEESLGRDTAMRRQMSSAEEALMAKLLRGKTTKQQKLIEKAFQNQALVDALLNQEAARQQALMDAKLAQGKIKKRNDSNQRLAEEHFQRLRKIFLGAIRSMDTEAIIQALEESRQLIEEGYLDLNRVIKEATGEGMLHQAAKYGRAEIIDWLVVQGGCRPNLPNVAKQTPLHFAALSLDPEGADQVSPDNAATSCMVLIESGGDVMAQDIHFDTPLAIAERLGFDLSNLANTPQAQEALAIERQREGMLAAQKLAAEQLANGGLYDEGDDAADEAEQRAAQAAADAAARLAEELAAQSTRIDPLTGLPMTAEQIAQSRAELEALMNEEQLEILPPPPPGTVLNDKEKIKAANAVFMQLCELFKEIVVPRNEAEAAALIKANTDLVKEGYLDLSRPVKHKPDGSTLLHAAVFHQKVNLVRQLLQHRADPNKKTIQGETPLHVACGLADREPHGKAIVSLLLEAGANPLLRDYKTGQSCFEQAPTAELRKWMEEWKPLAERQRLALAAQGGSGATDATRAGADDHAAENGFLDKLLKGKIAQQNQLVQLALAQGSALEAHALGDQLKQLESMHARLLKGKVKSAGDMLSNMLLAELSEPTKDKIMLTAEKWGEHPAGLAGLDIGVLGKVRGMPIADALKVLAAEAARVQEEQERLLAAINAPGLDEQLALEYERQFNVADCNNDIYGDLTNNMLQAERDRLAAAAQRGEQLTEDDLALLAAQEEMAAAAELERQQAADADGQARAVTTSTLPAGMLADICQLLSQYIAHNTGYEVAPELIMEGALPLDDLRSYQLDVDTITTMLSATDLEATKAFLLNQAQVNQAVGANVAQQLADEALPAQQRQEAEIHAKLCASNANLYDKLMGVLMGNGLDGQGMPDESAADDGSQSEQASKLVHPDTGLSVQMRISEVVLEQMRELAAEHLGISAPELRDMNAEQLQQALAKAGVNVDVMEELRKLTEAEAGKWLAKEMARNQAESDMLAKLLKGKGLSERQRAELLARKRALDDAADLYNDLLSTLLTGEKKKYAHMSEAEQLAQDRMLAKLAARRRKQDAQELEEREQRQHEELLEATTEVMRDTQHMVERPVLDPETGEPLLNEDGTPQVELVAEAWAAGSEVDEELMEKARQHVMHTLIRDNPPLKEQIFSLAAEHLGVSLSQLQSMTPEAASLLLVERGVDHTLLDHLQGLADEEAARHLAKEMSHAENEGKIVRKLLQGKDLTPEQRDALMSKLRVHDDNAKLYEDLLREVLADEQNHYDDMTPEQKAQHDALLLKLELRKARELARSKEQQVDESSPLMDLFDDLAPKGPYECRVCKTNNEAVNRACSFCKKSRADTLTLSEPVLWDAHRMLHQCSCPLSVIEVVHRSIGPCTKKNFLHFMQAATLACRRDAHVCWDVRGLDGEGLGALGPGPSELAWGFNDWDMDQPRYHHFRSKCAEPSGTFVGWTDFREECVQMPNVQDYQ